MNKINRSFLIGSMAVIGAALLWSIDGTFIRPQFYQFPAINIVFLEHLLGFIVLSPFIYFGWHKLKKIKAADIGPLLWVCFFGGLLGTLAITEAFFSAFRGEGAISTVIILQKLQPIFAILLARVILKEKMGQRFYFWAILGVISAAFIANGQFTTSLKDINFFNNAAVLAIIAAFAFGSSTVFGKRVVTDLGYKLGTALRFGITAVLAFITLGIAQLYFGEVYIINQLEPIHWKLLIVIVFSSGALALLLYYYGLKKTNASAATIFELSRPLSAIVMDYYFNGNVLTPTQIIFSIILLISFFMIVKGAKTQINKQKSK